MTLPSTLQIATLTHNQPFCAGVAVLQDNRLLLTLNPDGLPDELDNGSFWRIGGVGGGQEPGETIFECAAREGCEELNVPVELLHSPVTYFHDMDTDEVQAVTCTDAVAPFLLQRMTHPTPDRPYKPGLPAGPYLYLGLFLARPENDSLSPGDDVEGLIGVPIERFSLLNRQPTLESLLQQDITLIEQTTLPRGKRVWLPSDESFVMVARLLQQHPEILEQLAVHYASSKNSTET